VSNKKSPSTLVVGLALFSMFFGSGNLIFPLMLGAKYQAYFYICALGFVITAVVLPTLGIIAMIPAHGRYDQLFDKLLAPKYSRWFFLSVLLFWIPLGSGPRCVILAHASINTYLVGTPVLWLFSALFLTLVYFAVINRGRLIELLGKVLTPLLLISIFCIVISSLSTSGDLDPSAFPASEVFLKSIIDGYYTQDLIAAVFFSASLVGMLNQRMNQKLALEKTLRGGLIAVALLALLYGALMAASAIHGEYLIGLSGEKLVSALAKIALGHHFGGISSIAVSLACFTTEIALVLVFAEFLVSHLFKIPFKLALIITLVMVWLMSLLDFSALMAVIAPAMQIIYPILFILVIRLLWRKRHSFNPGA
jgi:LIVCS family branched-chain amino acid:cation transporter